MLDRVLTPTLVLLCGGALLHAQTNLVPNGGFENIAAATHLPAGGWWVYQGQGHADAAVDVAVAHAGNASVRLQANEDARFVLVSPPFDVSPGDELHYEGWIRTGSPTAAHRGYVGVAFRDAEGTVFNRMNVPTPSAAAEWTFVSGTATAPATAVRAEMHLGYTTAPGPLWFDDVRVAINNPLSLALVQGAAPWTGSQSITVRAINRGREPLDGALDARVGNQTTEVPVKLGAGAEQLVAVPVTLGTVGQIDYTLRLATGGTTARTLKGRFRTSPPLGLFPACPCYHLLGSGTADTRIDARIVMDPGRRAGLKLDVALSDDAGKELASATADASQGDIVGVNLPVPVGTVARFGITARLRDVTGKELAKADTDVHVVPADATRVMVEPDGYLRVAGQRQFTIGMYSASHLDEMARAGFTATHTYGIVTGDATDAINPNESALKEQLDRAAANGMRMMVELPRKAIEKAQWAQVRHRIETFRHHPGLLCWGSEERVARGEAPLANTEALYRIVHELDPDHPLVLGDTRDVISHLQKDRRSFFPDEAMDIGIWWWYPIPLQAAPTGNGLDGREKGPATLLEPPSWLTTTLSKKPLWIAVQSYQKPQREARFPTPVEYRCQAYLSIINGVKGIWYYIGSGGQRDWQGKAAGLLNKPEEAHWAYVQSLVHELRELSPVIMAKPVTGAIAMTPADAPVEFTVRQFEGATYLLVANKSEAAQTIRFTGAALAGRKAALQFETGSAAIEAGALESVLRPFGVHVYRIE